jgi:DNA primase
VPVKNLPAFLNAGLEARVVSLPEGHDPDTFVRACGAGALNKLSQEAPEIFNYWVEDLKRKAPDAGGVQAQLRRLGAARELLGNLTDQAKRQIVGRRLAEWLNIEESALADSRRADSQWADGRRPSAPSNRRPTARPEAGPPEVDQTALALLSLVLVHPETAGLVLESMSEFWPEDPSRLLFDRLREAFAARGGSGLESVQGNDLPEPLAGLVGQAALEPRVFPSGQAEGAAREHMGRLVAKWSRRRQAELSRDIARAQADGDEAEARRLAGEKEKVAALIRGLKKNWG